MNPIGDPYGAFVTENQIAVRGSGSGPLAGLTFGVKDAIDIAGARTGFGNPDWLRTHPPATRTASAVLRLLAAGAEMVGKTHTDELAYSLTGENVHYGTPSNPRAADRIPGGSSNGSAVAVAGNLVDFALGTDCGGSVRLPASYCGIFGMRPTHGRVPVDGVIPFAPSFDVVGWFARDVEVLRKVGTVILDPGQTAHVPRRLLVARDALAMADPEVSAALGPTTARLRSQFHVSECV
ncbi:MAG TPA: amidase family protein, partial [Bauldia sp.]|nr:amidase family protein [Bauldia sp.]